MVLSSQAANTANRAAILASRVQKHKNHIKNAFASQAAWQAAKAITKCALGNDDDECKEQE